MSKCCRTASKRKVGLLGYVSASVLASMIPIAAQAATVTNPNPNPGCNLNMAEFDPGSGQDINVPAGIQSIGICFRAEYADRDCLSLGRWRVRSLRPRIGGTGYRAHAMMKPQCRGEPSLRPIPLPPTSSYSIRRGTSSVRLASQRLRGSASRRRALLSTSLSERGTCRVVACSRPTFKPGDPRGRTRKQQLTYRDRRSNDRDGYAVQYGSANGRSPVRAVGVQG